MKSTILRGAAGVAAGALTLGVLGLTGPSATAAVVPAPGGSDPAPAALGAAYLARQADATGLIPYYSGATPSYFQGETLDAAVSLDAVGGQSSTVSTMASAVEASTYGTVSHSQAAKLAATEFTLGRANQRRADAVTAVNDHLETSGRLDDSYSPLDQVFAAKALFDGNASNAGAAGTFLLSQQCDAGFFASDYDGTDPDTSCNDQDAATPSVDTTALAVIELQDQKSTVPAVATAVTKAATWLASQQTADGSFVDAYSSTANANSTGLAAWALGISGNTGAAAKAAGWLRAHQLADAGSCASYAAGYNGGIAADDLGVKNAAGAPFDNQDNSTIAYATAQALPGLLWAAGGASAGALTATASGGRFVKAGSSHAVQLTGAPGDLLCVTTGTTHTPVVLPADGKAGVVVAVPQQTSTTPVSVVDPGGRTASVTFQVLAAADLKVKTAKRVQRGDRLKVKIKGLAAGEPTRIFLGAKRVAKVRANSHGVAKVRVKVKHKVGKVKIHAIGRFGDREQTVTIRVVR